MTILEKAKNLVNPMKWAQGFMIKKFAKRVAQFGAGALVALLADPKIADLLTNYGINLGMDKDKMSDAIAVLLVGLIGAIFNMAKHGPLKTEGDVPTAPPAAPK